MADVDPLHLQEERGLFAEEINKIVDGVISDITSGHVVDAKTAVHNAKAAAHFSDYAKDHDLALIAVKHGCPEHLRRKILKLALEVMLFRVDSALETRPEYQALKTERTENHGQDNTEARRGYETGGTRQESHCQEIGPDSQQGQEAPCGD